MTSGDSTRPRRPPSRTTMKRATGDVVRGTFVVKNRLGLHARAATKLVLLAGRFPCEITIGRDGQFANAKSVMGVLLLCGSKGTKLTLEATGPEASTAIQQLGELIEAGFGEQD